MSPRSTLRIKVVLPVTVSRDGGRQKQVALTLDATSNSARLASLQLPIEPGEIIELQRNTMRAKFKVFWVGAPGSLLTGQAGVRALDGTRSIWGLDFPQDQPDMRCDPRELRSGLPMARSLQTAPTETPVRRQEIKGGASVRANGYSHAIYAQILDISESGVQLKTPSLLPPGTEVYVLLNLAGFVVEVPGVVRASDLQSGMHIGFSKMSACTQEKLFMAIRSLQEPELIVDPKPAATSPLAESIKLAI
jgi:hypothetical protein